MALERQSGHSVSEWLLEWPNMQIFRFFKFLEGLKYSV